MQWEDSLHAGFTEGKPFSKPVTGKLGYKLVNVAAQMEDSDSLFHTIKRMIAVRKRHAAFASSGMEWVEANNPAVAVYLRHYEDDTMLIINNLSSSEQTICLPVEYQRECLDLLKDASISLTEEMKIQPYAYLWLHMQKP